MEHIRILSITISPDPVKTGQQFLIKADVTTITPDSSHRLPGRLPGRLGVLQSDIYDIPRLSIILGRKEGKI